MTRLDVLLAVCDRVLAVCDAATAGPWSVTHDADGEVWGINSPRERIVETDMGFYPPGDSDASLIVLSRTALPAFVKAAKNVLRDAHEWEDKYLVDSVAAALLPLFNEQEKAEWGKAGGE